MSGKAKFLLKHHGGDVTAAIADCRRGAFGSQPAVWYLRVSGSLEAAIADLVDTSTKKPANLVGKRVVAVVTSERYDIDYGTVYTVVNQLTDYTGRTWVALDYEDSILVPIEKVKRVRTTLCSTELH